MTAVNYCQAYRAKILHFVDDPYKKGEHAWQYFEDGILLVADGKVANVGPANTLMSTLPPTTIIENSPNRLLIPGFIDTHIHYPQTQMIGAYGEQLLEWLDNYTFPCELSFSDAEHAAEASRVFIDELLRNGTTTALVFGTVHPQSVEAFFCESHKRNLRMIAGKVLMDRNAPPELCDTPESGYADSKALIERWHNKGRQAYAITPRFAPTSSPEQLALAGQLLAEHPGVYLHTHLSENQNEVEWVKNLYPSAKHYLDAYGQANLLTRRSIFAHGIHLCGDQCQQLANNKSSIAHCPTSNLFLGSGLFNLQKMRDFDIQVGLGTDIGAGTSFSLFKTMDEAYKIQQLRQQKLDPFSAFYLATLGGARALDLEGTIGNFMPGNEADFILLDLQATPLLKYRTPFCQSLSDLLFCLITLGDDRLIAKTFAMGRCVHNRDGDVQ